MARSPFDFKIPNINVFGFDNKTTTRTSCPKAVKEAVWHKYNGDKMKGKCYVCNKEITFTSFEVGHNKAASKGGKWTVANCRPLCRTCNRSMGTTSIETFKKKHFSSTEPKAKKTTPKDTTTKKRWHAIDTAGSHPKIPQSGGGTPLEYPRSSQVPALRPVGSPGRDTQREAVLTI